MRVVFRIPFQEVFLPVNDREVGDGVTTRGRLGQVPPPGETDLELIEAPEEVIAGMEADPRYLRVDGLPARDLATILTDHGVSRAEYDGAMEA